MKIVNGVPQLEQKDITDFYDLKKNPPGGLSTVEYINKLIKDIMQQQERVKLTEVIKSRL